MKKIIIFILLAYIFTNSTPVNSYDQIFDTIKLRYWYWYKFGDIFNNHWSYKIWIDSYTNTFNEAFDFNWWSNPTFSFTPEIIATDYEINPNQSLRVQESTQYNIISVWTTRASSVFSIVYSAKYYQYFNGSWDWPYTHSEYQPYQITWCWDWTIDNFKDLSWVDILETCDDWNNIDWDGCSATCQIEPPPAPVCWTANGRTFAYTDTSWGTYTFCSPWTPNPNPPTFPSQWWNTSWTCNSWWTSVNCSANRWSPPVVSCNNLTTSPTTWNIPFSSSMQCIWSNATSYSINCWNWQTISASSWNCNYTSTWTFSAVCNVNWNITSPACSKTITANYVPPPSCNALSITPISWTNPLTSSFTCQATNATSYSIQIFSWATVINTINSSTWSYTFNTAWNYTAKCSINNWSITSSSCEWNITVSEPPVVVTSSCNNLIINPNFWTWTLTSNFTCQATNATSYLIQISSWSTVINTIDSSTWSFIFNTAWNYTAKCTINGNITNSNCDWNITVNTPPPLPPPPQAPVCWTANNITFAHSDTNWLPTHIFCSSWTPNPNPPTFPTPWWTTSWTCNWVAWSTPANCSASRWSPPTSSCFPAWTKITMWNWVYKNIEEVKSWDEVLAYDEISKKNIVSEVLEIESPVRDHMCKLSFDNWEYLRLTSEHPVYTKNWWASIEPEETKKENPELFVKKLENWDYIQTVWWEYLKLLNIECSKEIIQTYNLKSVKNYHTFYADNILVHNKWWPTYNCTSINAPNTGRTYNISCITNRPGDYQIYIRKITWISSWTNTYDVSTQKILTWRSSHTFNETDIWDFEIKCFVWPTYSISTTFCTKEITLNSPTIPTPSPAPATSCWDWTKDSTEDCDYNDTSHTDWKNVGWLLTCNTGCTVPTSTLPWWISVTSSDKNILIWHWMDIRNSLSTHILSIENNTSTWYAIANGICSYLSGSYLTGTSDKYCDNRDIIINSRDVFNFDIPSSVFAWDIIWKTVKFWDSQIITTFNDLWKDTTSNLKSIVNVRVAKPTVNTVWWGASLLNWNNFSDTNALSNAWWILAPAKNKNLILTSIWSGALSSYVLSTSNSWVIAKTTTDWKKDLNSFSWIITSTAWSYINTLPNEKYNWLDNVFIYNWNVNLNSDLTISLTWNTTYIIEWNLNINSNLTNTSSKNILFVVKNWTITIASSVTQIDAILINIWLWWLIKWDITTTNRLIINGALYWNVDELLWNRTYIKDRWEYVDVGTIVNFTSKIFSSPPPLLSRFLWEYLNFNKIAK